MRPFRELTFKGKVKRIFYQVIWDFLLDIIGGYKRGGILGLYHWLRCHIWNRYHIIDISKVDTGPDPYRWGWVDRDKVLLLACFKVLCDFVEKEDDCLSNFSDYSPKPREECAEDIAETIDAQIAEKRKIRALYEWWTIRRRIDWDELDDMYTQPKKYKDPMTILEHEEALHKKDEEMLIELMKLRRLLWT